MANRFKVGDYVISRGIVGKVIEMDRGSVSVDQAEGRRAAWLASHCEFVPACHVKNWQYSPPQWLRLTGAGRYSGWGIRHPSARPAFLLRERRCFLTGYFSRRKNAFTLRRSQFDMQCFPTRRRYIFVGGKVGETFDFLKKTRYNISK